jgi:hypothetical protein
MYLDELKKDIGDPLSEDGFQLLTDEVATQVATGYIADQMDLVNYISQLLTDKGQQVAKDNPKRYDELQRFWVSLAFAAFQGYSLSDKDNLLQRRILYAIQKGFDPQILLNQTYSLYHSEAFIQEVFRGYAHDLEENTETFGSAPITVEGRRMLPQLKYWVLDYSKFPSKVAKRGAVERLNYVDNSANTKALTQGQRDTLLSILKLYDEFLNPTIPEQDASEGYDYDLAGSYAEAPREPLSSAQSQLANQPVLARDAHSTDQELIAHKLKDLRERTKDGVTIRKP